MKIILIIVSILITIDNYAMNKSDSTYNPIYEDAFNYIKKDSSFQHYSMKYQYDIDKIAISNIYIWNDLFWDEIINLKFSNIDTNIKNNILNLFKIVKYFYNSKEEKDYFPLKSHYSESDLILIFSFIREDLFTLEIFFLTKPTQIDDTKNIYANTFVSIAYLFYLKNQKIETVFRKILAY